MIARRGELGWIVPELARRMGVPSSNVRRFEAGAEVKLSFLIRLADALDAEIVIAPGLPRPKKQPGGTTRAGKA